VEKVLWCVVDFWIFLDEGDTSDEIARRGRNEKKLLHKLIIYFVLIWFPALKSFDILD